MLWLALTVMVVVPLAGLAYAAVQGLSAWRAFRGFTRDAGGAAEQLAARADALAARDPYDSARLDESLARLRSSTARLAILTGALGRVRSQWSALLAVYPRK